MHWKKSAEETVREIRSEGLEKTLEDVESSYVVDQRELGKIVFISSLALAVAAIPSAMTLNEAQEDVDGVNSDLASLQGVATSGEFQDRVDTLRTRVGGSLGRTLGTAYNTIQSANQSISSLESTERRLEKRTQTYRWLSLVSLVGMAAGLTTMYV